MRCLKLLAFVLTPALLLTILSPGPIGGQEEQRDPDIAIIRNNYANRYFEIRPHMELAQRLRMEGRNFSALVMAERARGIFGHEESDKVWLHVFHGLDIERPPEEEGALLARIEAEPGSVEVLQKLTRHYQFKDDRHTSTAYLKRLILADPEHITEHLYAHAEFRDYWLFSHLDEILNEFAARYPEAPESAVASARRVLESDPGLARGILLTAVERHPENALLHFHLAKAAKKLGDLDEAERRLVRAATLRSGCERYQGAVAEFLLEEREDEVRALPWMFATHFLNPYHFSDHRDSTVSRIAKIGLARARERAPEGTTVEEMIRSGDTFQAIMAVQAMRSEWKPEYVGLATELLSHSFDNLASGAAQLLAKHVDPSFEPQLAVLRESPNLVLRARALFIDVGMHREKAYLRVREAFRSECHLIRYEALGALYYAGGEAGRAIVLEHRAREKNEMMLRAIKADLATWKDGD